MYCRFTTSISQEELDLANKILSSRFDDLGETTSLFKNFVFSEGVEVSITACAGEENGYVDAVLFKHGHEMNVQARYDFLGKYSFMLDNDIYEVVLELED